MWIPGPIGAWPFDRPSHDDGGILPASFPAAIRRIRHDARPPHKFLKTGPLMWAGRFSSWLAAPWSVNVNRIAGWIETLERVKVEAGNVHFFRPHRSVEAIQPCKDTFMQLCSITFEFKSGDADRVDFEQYH